DPPVPADHPAVPDSAACAAVRRLVLLHGALLPDALAARIYGHGHAVVPAGRRDRARHLFDLPDLHPLTPAAAPSRSTASASRARSRSRRTCCQRNRTELSTIGSSARLRSSTIGAHRTSDGGLSVNAASPAPSVAQSQAATRSRTSRAESAKSGPASAGTPVSTRMSATSRC